MLATACAKSKNCSSKFGTLWINSRGEHAAGHELSLLSDCLMHVVIVMRHPSQLSAWQN